jgi:hypothetical protein
MATVDSDKVVCGGIHAMIVAVLVLSVLLGTFVLLLATFKQKKYPINDNS